MLPHQRFEGALVTLFDAASELDIVQWLRYYDLWNHSPLHFPLGFGALDASACATVPVYGQIAQNGTSVRVSRGRGTVAVLRQFRMEWRYHLAMTPWKDT